MPLTGVRADVQSWALFAFVVTGFACFDLVPTPAGTIRPRCASSDLEDEDDTLCLEVAAVPSAAHMPSPIFWRERSHRGRR